MKKVDKLIGQSKEHLNTDEIVVAVVLGAYETDLLGSDTLRNGIFIATEDRIVFYAKRMAGFDMESYSYSNISSLEISKSMMGYQISFFSTGNKVSMKWINEINAREKDIAGFVEYVRNRIEEIPSSESIQQEQDIPDQIKKLAELKDQGILTEEEFGSKKQELLKRL